MVHFIGVVAYTKNAEHWNGVLTPCFASVDECKAVAGEYIKRTRVAAKSYGHGKITKDLHMTIWEVPAEGYATIVTCFKIYDASGRQFSVGPAVLPNGKEVFVLPPKTKAHRQWKGPVDHPAPWRP